MNLHLSYKPPSYWRILFRSGGYLSQFSRLKKFRSLVVPGGDCRKGVILQVILTPAGILPNGQSCLRRKRDLAGAYAHAPRQSNSMYAHTARRYIYKTRRPENPHSPIHQYKQCPQGPASRPRYTMMKGAWIPMQWWYRDVEPSPPIKVHHQSDGHRYG